MVSILLEGSHDLLSFARLSPPSGCPLSLLHQVPFPILTFHLLSSSFFLLLFYSSSEPSLPVYFPSSLTFFLPLLASPSSPCLSCASSPLSASLCLIEAVLLGNHSHRLTVLELLPPALASCSSAYVLRLLSFPSAFVTSYLPPFLSLYVLSDFICINQSNKRY